MDAIKPTYTDIGKGTRLTNGLEICERSETWHPTQLLASSKHACKLAGRNRNTDENESIHSKQYDDDGHFAQAISMVGGDMTNDCRR